MTHKIKIVSLLMVSAMLFFAGCKKNNSENETNEINETPEETFDEVIPEEIIQLLDNCPITNYQDISEFGFHGKSDNPLDNMFATMCQTGMCLTDTTEYIAGADPVKEPRQKGLAYVKGYGHIDDKDDPNHYSETKDYRIRRRGFESKCDDEYLHGIDCSGFIAHVMNAAGVGVKPNGKNVLFGMTASQQVDYFKQLTALNTSQYTMVNVKVKEFKNVKKKFIKNGDIIYKINKKGEICHIGIFLIHKTSAGKEELIMFQSSGSKNYDCQENRHENGRGPIQREVNEENLDTYFEKDGEGRLLRITPIIETNWVDLGLPSGNLWATRNVGANSPEESGYYLAWDEAAGYSYWEDYWGNGCHTPTKNDWNELDTCCSGTWKVINGVGGRLYREKYIVSNGDSLFLPAAGFLHEGNIYNTGQYDGWGFYWSSSRSENNPNNAWYIRFNSEGLFALSEYLRLFGLSVRPVRSPN